MRLYQGEVSIGEIGNFTGILNPASVKMLMEDLTDERCMDVLACPISDYQAEHFRTLHDMIRYGRLDPIEIVGVLAAYQATDEFRTIFRQPSIEWPLEALRRPHPTHLTLVEKPAQ